MVKITELKKGYSHITLKIKGTSFFASTPPVLMGHLISQCSRYCFTLSSTSHLLTALPLVDLLEELGNICLRLLGSNNI